MISDEVDEHLVTHLKTGIGEGLLPHECARIIFEAIHNEQFWAFTHENFKDNYRTRADSGIESTNPVYQTYVTT